MNDYKDLEYLKTLQVSCIEKEIDYLVCYLEHGNHPEPQKVIIDYIDNLLEELWKK